MIIIILLLSLLLLSLLLLLLLLLLSLLLLYISMIARYFPLLIPSLYCCRLRDDHAFPSGQTWTSMVNTAGNCAQNAISGEPSCADFGKLTEAYMLLYRGMCERGKSPFHHITWCTLWYRVVLCINYWFLTKGIHWSRHWNENVVILTKYSSLTALEVVILTTSSAVSDENFIKMKTFPLSGVDSHHKLPKVFSFCASFHTLFEEKLLHPGFFHFCT